MTNGREDRLSRAIAGDHNAFREIYDLHVGLVQYIGVRLRLTSEERDDLVQEVFVRLYRSLSKINSEAKIKSWLASTARNYAIDQMRRPQSRRVDAIGNDIEQTAGNPDMEDAFQKEINQVAAELWLTEITAEPGGLVFKQFYVEGLSVREISAKSGEAVSTITARLSRMRNKFRGRLQQLIDKVRAETKVE